MHLNREVKDQREIVGNYGVYGYFKFVDNDLERRKQAISKSLRLGLAVFSHVKIARTMSSD